LGATGYAQDIFAEQFNSIEHITQAEFYLCGPPGLMTATIEFLKRNGIRKEAITFDDFS
jgi:Na+-transporting NADH:ubiquinone oxidoreductase subunit NqrF